mgnify:CR=1 FL=1
MHFYGYKQGLKTGMYYLRSRPAADAIKFTVDQETKKADVSTTPVQAMEALAVKAQQAAIFREYEAKEEPMMEMGAGTTLAPTSRPLSPREQKLAQERQMNEAEFLAAQQACSLENPEACDMCGS